MISFDALPLTDLQLLSVNKQSKVLAFNPGSYDSELQNGRNNGLDTLLQDRSIETDMARPANEYSIFDAQPTEHLLGLLNNAYPKSDSFAAEIVDQRTEVKSRYFSFGNVEYDAIPMLWIASNIETPLGNDGNLSKDETVKLLSVDLHNNKSTNEASTVLQTSMLHSESTAKANLSIRDYGQAAIQHFSIIREQKIAVSDTYQSFTAIPLAPLTPLLERSLITTQTKDGKQNIWIRDFYSSESVIAHMAKLVAANPFGSTVTLNKISINGKALGGVYGD